MEEFYLVKPYEHVLLREGLDRAVGGKAFVADKIYRRIVDKVGEEPVTVLGSGDKGVVYGLPSGKVLKVTSDEGELRAMNLLRGRRHPNLAQVFDVFVVPIPGSEEAWKKPGAQKRGVGVIVREAVDDTISDSGAYRALDRRLRENTFRGNDTFIRRRQSVGPRQALWEAMIQFTQDLDEDPDKDMLPTDRRLVPGIKDALEELLALGIYVVDVKGSNVGLIEDRPVLFDLSLASVPEEAPDIELGRPKRLIEP